MCKPLIAWERSIVPLISRYDDGADPLASRCCGRDRHNTHSSAKPTPSCQVVRIRSVYVAELSDERGLEQRALSVYYMGPPAEVLAQGFKLRDDTHTRIE